MAHVAELSKLCDDNNIMLDRSALLSAREQEILALIKQNLSNREIAEHLELKLGTVKNHVHNILKKLNVDNRRAAKLYV